MSKHEKCITSDIKYTNFNYTRRLDDHIYIYAQTSAFSYSKQNKFSLDATR